MKTLSANEAAIIVSKFNTELSNYIAYLHQCDVDGECYGYMDYDLELGLFNNTKGFDHPKHLEIAQSLGISSRDELDAIIEKSNTLFTRNELASAKLGDFLKK